MKLLQALRGENKGRPPVWFMRQAGRFLPEYRALRKEHSLSKLFHTPGLAAKVTLQPVTRLNVDAAILFSDILVVTEVLGYTIEFPEKGGIVLKKPTKPVERLTEETLHYVQETIGLLKPELKVPLIGFAGGPYTVARYMGEVNHETLQRLTRITIEYLQMQIRSGVSAIQIFDSWAGLLDEADFKEYSLPYLRCVVDALRPLKVPVIVFCRGSCKYVKELVSLEPHAISFDWEEDLREMIKKVPPHIAIQGNLDPEIFKGPYVEVERRAREILEAMWGEGRYIFNLGHGVLPDTPVENGVNLVRLVQSG